MLIKTGIGYDIHRFSEGRKLILGGVDIPFDRGLEGHSDADVLLHAVCDAILGAMGEGDIGEHFPNTDAKYRDVSSLVLLKEVYDLLCRQGFSISNVDTVIQAEEPNIKQYKTQMRRNIAEVLNIDQRDVNIKATTQERLGAIGRKEGVAAFASVLLMKRSS